MLLQILFEIALSTTQDFQIVETVDELTGKGVLTISIRGRRQSRSALAFPCGTSV